MKSFLTSLFVLAFSISQAQTFTNYTDVDGLANNGVNCLDVAANDVMWFGTQAGVSVFDGTNWTAHNTGTDAGFVDDVITAIKVLNNGDVWVGTDFGAAHYDGTSWTTYTETDGLGDDRIKTITELMNGDIAFGTNDGFSTFDGTNWMSFGTGDGLPFGGITTINQNSLGVLYLGTALGGIAISDINGFSEITEDDTLLNDKVRVVEFDAQDNLWVGTSDGISVYDENNFWSEQHTRPFELPAPDTLNPIEDIVIDSQGNIWAGVYVDYLVTEGGISAYNGTEWTQFEPSDGLIGPVVRQLVVDSQDNIWIATSTGVSKLSDVDLGGGSGTGIFNPEVSTLNVYPNPANDLLNIELSVKNETNQIEVFDAAMRSVMTENINQRTGIVQVSVADLKSGFYLVRIGNGVSRILIQ